MATYQITCITLSSTIRQHEYITHVGGSFGVITKADAVSYIENGTHIFYVSNGFKSSWVGVVREAGKAPYLRTHADNYYNDNLLSLKNC